MLKIMLFPERTFLEGGGGDINDIHADRNILGENYYIEEKNLDISSVSTTCQTTRKIYVVLGYQTTWKNPLMERMNFLISIAHLIIIHFGTVLI